MADYRFMTFYNAVEKTRLGFQARLMDETYHKINGNNGIRPAGLNSSALSSVQQQKLNEPCDVDFRAITLCFLNNGHTA